MSTQSLKEQLSKLEAEKVAELTRDLTLPKSHVRVDITITTDSRSDPTRTIRHTLRVPSGETYVDATDERPLLIDYLTKHFARKFAPYERA